MAALSGSPTAMPNSVAGNSAVTGGGEKLGSTSVDNAGSSNSANSATGIPSAKESNPSGTTATPNASSSPSPPNSSDNSSNNEAQDGNMLQTSSSGSIKIWGAFCGVAVALVAIAGIAFLVVQQRMRARRELLAEQRNAEMHNVHPEHRRESLLPYVQNVLGSNNAIQPPPAAVNH
ncbi:hypothetical protein BDF19DRAFT_426361 [Syncephalis fuscata]|nr:hypothetical protein BDF19DRAFT_426361 [Syncephalis fuscata]